MRQRKPKRKRACVVCKAAHAACDRGTPCSRCVALGKGAECKESLPMSSSGVKKQKTTPPVSSPSLSSPSTTANTNSPISSPNGAEGTTASANGRSVPHHAPIVPNLAGRQASNHFFFAQHSKLEFLY